MYTRYLGSPRKTALVFLHGFMGSGEDWVSIAEHFRQDFFCLLPDLPGHAATPLDASPGYESWGVLLRDMLLAHDIEQFCLIGYSLGGRLALYFSLTYPEMIQQLVLESANPGIRDGNTRRQRAARDALLAEQILHDGMDTFVRAWYDLPLFASLNRYPELKSEMHRQRARQSPQNMAAVLRALSPGRQIDLSARLGEIQVPTLLLTGQLDQKYSVVVRSMAQAIPNSHMVLLDGCGHNVHRECTTLYVKHLKHWLKSPIDC